MKWRGRTLGVDSPMPEHPLAQHHWSPKVGDRISAWKHVPAGGVIDGNVTPAAGHLWWMHSRKPGQMGYTRVLDGGHVRKMTRRELRRDADAWGYNGILRWRDAHGQHPLTHDAGLAWLVEHHIVAIQEAKFPLWAAAEWPFERLYANCKRHGHPAWAKRLVTLRLPRATVVMAHRAKVQIAAIYGKGLRGRARRLAHTLKAERSWRGVRFDATW